MPCLCQYFSTELGLRVEDSLNVKDNLTTEEGSLLREVSTGDVTASELAACKAEIFSLKSNLIKAKISSGNMENLMKAMIEKQNLLITEVYELRKLNEDLRLQQVTDRNNQALERGVLLREMHEIKILLRDRSSVIERTLQHNFELTNALKDANEKIYEMGIKFLKLKSNRSSSRDGSSEGPSIDAQSSDDGIHIEGDISQDLTVTIAAH